MRIVLDGLQVWQEDFGYRLLPGYDLEQLRLLHRLVFEVHEDLFPVSEEFLLAEWMIASKMIPKRIICSSDREWGDSQLSHVTGDEDLYKIQKRNGMCCVRAVLEEPSAPHCFAVALPSLEPSTHSSPCEASKLCSFPVTVNAFAKQA